MSEISRCIFKTDNTLPGCTPEVETCNYDCPHMFWNKNCKNPLHLNETHEDFVARMRYENSLAMQEGVLLGWWDEIDEKGNPVKYTRLKMTDGPMMSHALVKAGCFVSVSQARKAGWDKPIAPGKYKIGKHKPIWIEEN